MRVTRYDFRLMVRLGVHVGHFNKMRNVNILYYLWKVRCGLDFINLRYTFLILKLLLKLVEKLQVRQQLVLLVNNKFAYGPSIETTVAKTFKFLKQSYISQECPPGVLTNYKNVYATLVRERFLKHKGLKVFTRMPAMVFGLTYKEYCSNWLSAECFGLNLVSSFLVDTNQTPYGIVYPIPANNDGVTSLVWFCNLFKQSLFSGYLGKSLRPKVYLKKRVKYRIKG